MTAADGSLQRNTMLTEPANPTRLAVCFDGTWNSYDQQTNVSRLYAAIADAQSGCGEQLKFYDEGVGTTSGERLRGGLFGRGLDQNILQGYCWLIDNYLPGALLPADDQGQQFSDGSKLYILGFSRGAFTARSLCGLINRCG